MAKKTATRKMQDKRHAAQAGEELNSAEAKVGNFLHNFVRPNWPVLVAMVLIAIVAVLVILEWQQREKQQLAGAFAEVKTAKTISALRKLADKYGTQAPGELAAFLVARRLYEEAQYVETANAFEQFVENFPNSKLKVDAYFGWAYSLENNNLLADAQTIYLKISEMARAAAEGKAEAFCGAARTAYALDKQEKARQYYEAAMSAVDQGYYKEQAQEMLKRMDRDTG